ncbi:MAG: methylated-DNA--[protein]-cysteine S-methyltransferase [Chitinophagaceae bacterium]|nr:MAG: methylated-DNA--[protein]-cysteine S-methyltransferase [Chitinophagaceae bacterium]
MSTETVFYKSPVGILELTGDADYLASVYFVSTEKNGVKETALKNSPEPGSPVLQETVKQLDEYFAGKRMEFELPLKQNGTPFQQKVWEGLRDIKAGNNISYLTFSKRLGDVKAIRAVGTANGKNNISIIVPCHRVIGSNGSLVGYGGDLWRKKWLLEHEAKYSNAAGSLFDQQQMPLSSFNNL